VKDRPLPRHLLEWARRHEPRDADELAPSNLHAGRGDGVIARDRGMPRAARAGIRSFYDQLGHESSVCDGTSCHFAGGDALAERLRGLAPIDEVRCLGHCYAAPSFRSGDRVYAKPSHMDVEAWLAHWGEGPDPVEDILPIPRHSLTTHPVVLRNLLIGTRPAGASEYDLPDGAAILAAVDAAKLNGRGGADYPTAAKWRAARDTPAPDRFVVANGDEGDPGSFVDRLLLEDDPHVVLAGMVACARVIGARRGIVYIRAEYPHARETTRRAIVEARRGGWFGPDFDVEVVSGAGSYVCGEETALLRSIEGLRGEHSPKPPYPAQSGLFGLPTVVQNVETLSAVPWIVRTGRSAGTKVVCVAGAVRSPGAVEVDLGTSLLRVLEQGAGGAPEGRRWRMALIGGPMGRVLPAASFDTPLSYKTLPGMGHAGVVVLDDTVTPRALAEHLFAFARAESCGNCAPCRIGTARLAEVRGRSTLERLLETMRMGSLCAFGQQVPTPIRDLLTHFGDEVLG
jgi:formate dehydrogenase iron-sulfur subunit